MEIHSSLLFIWTLFTFCLSVNGISIEDNAYKGISISFSRQIKEEQIDFIKLKEVLTKSSEYLYHATRKRSYYGEFIVVVPPEWTGVNDWSEVNVTEAPRNIDIYITDSPEDATILKAQHSKECGSTGDIIYMPLAWLEGNDINELAFQFVQQWSIFRYGVFEENTDANNSCFASRANTWSPAGCYNSKIEYEYKNINFEDGLPICSFPDGFFNRTDLTSSLMFMNVSKDLHYCDGSTYPHNPVMPTLHNNLCQGKNVWSIITSSEDFAQRKNPSRTDLKPPTETIFKYLREPKMQVIFAVQNGSRTDLTEAMITIRYSFFHFLSHLAPTDVKLNLVTFSNKIATEAQTVVELNATSKDLEQTLSTYVMTKDIVNHTCLICGLNKTLKVSQKYNHTLPIVLLIAWESTLTGLKVSDFVALIKEYPTVIIHLVLVEDTENEVIFPELVEAIRATGGQIYSLTKEIALMSSKMKVILANIMKSLFHLEDKIIVAHEATFMGIKTEEPFNDSFVTPKAAENLLYTMHCSNTDVNVLKGDCTRSSQLSCLKAMELGNREETTWDYSYKIQSGVDSHICSSVALVSLNPTSEDSYILRGWLSSNTIIPGGNGLIIYAEIISLLKQEYSVGARISGPGIKKPIEIELLDNGNGDPDTKKGDGIFSRYFTLFKEKGTYIVSVFASVTAAEEAMFAASQAARKAVNPVQTKIIGSFTVLKKPPSVDIIPPNRICDLKVTSVDHDNSTVELQWTAPGNDYDYGNAAGYDVYITEDWKDLQDSMLTKIQPEILRDVEALKPQDGGEKEQRKFTLGEKPEPVLYYIAVRGVDNSSNRAKLSNVIQVFAGKLEDETSIDTVENTTKNSTDCTTESTMKSHLLMDNFHFLILAVALSAIILIVILINILVWVLCFKKYKAEYATDRAAKDVSENKEIPSHHKSAKNSDYGKQYGYVNRTMIQSASGTDEQYKELEHISVGNPTVLYGKVNKKDKTKNLTKSRSQEREFEMRKSLHVHQNQEDDLGFV